MTALAAAAASPFHQLEWLPVATDFEFVRELVDGLAVRIRTFDSNMKLTAALRSGDGRVCQKRVEFLELLHEFVVIDVD